MHAEDHAGRRAGTQARQHYTPPAVEEQHLPLVLSEWKLCTYCCCSTTRGHGSVECTTLTNGYFRKKPTAVVTICVPDQQFCCIINRMRKMGEKSESGSGMEASSQTEQRSRGGCSIVSPWCTFVYIILVHTYDMLQFRVSSC